MNFTKTSLLALAFLATGCSDGYNPPKHTGPDHVVSDPRTEYGTDTGGSEDTATDTGVLYDTDFGIGDTSGEEPCGVAIAWNVTDDNVTVDAFVMPRLEITTTCDASFGLNALKIEFTSEEWVGDLPDNRLGVGNGDIAPLGVYPGTLSEDLRTMTWSASLDSYGVYFSPGQPVDIGLSLAAFYNDERMAEVTELWDNADDTVSLAATVSYSVDGASGGAVQSETVLTITPE